jgi:hypothetical protein
MGHASSCFCLSDRGLRMTGCFHIHSFHNCNAGLPGGQVDLRDWVKESALRFALGLHKACPNGR